MATDWPLSAQELNEFILRKYDPMTKEEIHSTTHTYRSAGGRGITGDYLWLKEIYNHEPTIVTLFEHEHEQNELKRQILVVSPVHIRSWESKFKEQLSE
jgi:hypothetical protein